MSDCGRNEDSIRPGDRRSVGRTGPYFRNSATGAGAEPRRETVSAALYASFPGMESLALGASAERKCNRITEC